MPISPESEAMLLDSMVDIPLVLQQPNRHGVKQELRARMMHTYIVSNMFSDNKAIIETYRKAMLALYSLSVLFNLFKICVAGLTTHNLRLYCLIQFLHI